MNWHAWGFRILSKSQTASELSYYGLCVSRSTSLPTTPYSLGGRRVRVVYPSILTSENQLNSRSIKIISIIHTRPPSPQIIGSLQNKPTFSPFPMNGYHTPPLKVGSTPSGTRSVTAICQYRLPHVSSPPVLILCLGNLSSICLYSLMYRHYAVCTS